MPAVAPEAPAPPVEATAPAAMPPSVGSAGALQVVGGDRLHVIFLDTGAAEWTAEAFEVGDLAEVGRPVAAAAFLGCGRLGAVRTRSDYAIFDRTGRRLSRAALPDLVEALGDRLTPTLTELGEEYEPIDDPHDAVRRGELVRADDGSLAIATEIALVAFHGELEGCLRIEEALRVTLPLPDGLGDTTCARPEVRAIDPWSYRSPPDGWRCARRDTSADGATSAAPTWLGIGWDEAVVHVEVSEDCRESVEDPWERLADCESVPEVIGCRRDGDPSIYLTTMPPESEGCAHHPEIVVLRDGRAVARTGRASRMLEVERTLVAFGGDTQWFVASSEHAPVRFGVVTPDFVRAP